MVESTFSFVNFRATSLIDNFLLPFSETLFERRRGIFKRQLRAETLATGDYYTIMLLTEHKKWVPLLGRGTQVTNQLLALMTDSISFCHIPRPVWRREPVHLFYFSTFVSS